MNAPQARARRGAVSRTKIERDVMRSVQKANAASTSALARRGYRRLRRIRVTFRRWDKTGVLRHYMCYIRFVNTAAGEEILLGGPVEHGRVVLRDVWIPASANRRDCTLTIYLLARAELDENDGRISYFDNDGRLLLGDADYVVSRQADTLEFEATRLTETVGERYRAEQSRINGDEREDSATIDGNGKINLGPVELGGGLSTTHARKSSRSTTDTRGAEIERQAPRGTDRLLIHQVF